MGRVVASCVCTVNVTILKLQRKKFGILYVTS